MFLKVIRHELLLVNSLFKRSILAVGKFIFMSMLGTYVFGTILAKQNLFRVNSLA